MFTFLFHPSSRSYAVAKEILAGVATCLFGAFLTIGVVHLARAQSQYGSTSSAPAQGTAPTPTYGSPQSLPPNFIPGQPPQPGQPQPGQPPGDRKREEEYQKKYDAGQHPSEPASGGSYPKYGQPQYGQPPSGQPYPQPYQPKPYQSQPFSDPNRQEQPFDRGQQDQKNDEMMRKRMEEDSSKRQQEEEKRREADEARQKAEMKRGYAQMKRGMRQMLPMLKRMSDRVASMEKSGLTVPGDIKATIESALQSLNLLLNAESPEDPGVETAMADLQTKNDDLRDAMQRLEMVSNVSRMLKQAQNEIRRVESAYSRAKRIAERSKIDVSAQLQAFDQTLLAMKAGLDKARQLLASGDGEAAMETIQEDVFYHIEDAYQYEGLIRALQNIRSHLNQLDRMLSNAKREIARRERRKEDVSEIKAQLDEIVVAQTEIKTLLAQKGTSPDELRDAMENLFTKVQDLVENLDLKNAGPFGAPPKFQPQQKEGGEEFQGFSFPSFRGEQ